MSLGLKPRLKNFKTYYILMKRKENQGNIGYVCLGLLSIFTSWVVTDRDSVYKPEAVFFQCSSVRPCA